MDAADLERLLARTHDPRLVPGIYNYCDGRCARCPFTDRCLTFRDSHRDAADERESDGGSTTPPLTEMIGVSLQRTVDALIEAGRRLGIDLTASSPDERTTTAALAAAFDAYYEDPLVVGAREYGTLAWRIAKALGPIVALREDPDVADAVATIEWFAVLIGSKLYRAVAGRAVGWSRDDDPQADHDGSAKVALLGIRESIDAWRVLMDRGKATANGVPARAVSMLEELEVTTRARFPRAMTFVRPGFDEPQIAAGGLVPRRAFDHAEADEPPARDAL
jgi:hypothetical protein